MEAQSQRDPRWKNQQLGTSNLSIGQAGCTITAIAIKFGTTPDVVNQRLNAVGGYFDKNLVIWKKLEEALPGVIFKWKSPVYENEIVKANIPCIVEVNGSPIGAPRHWVLFIGNKRLYDPWDGQEKSTAEYTPLSFVLLEGEFKNKDARQANTDNCLVPNTPAWRKTYEEIVRKASQYDKFVNAGFASFTDVLSTIEGKDREIADLKKRTTEANNEKVVSLKSEIPSIVKAAKLIEGWGQKWIGNLADVKEPVVDKSNPSKPAKSKDTLAAWLKNIFDNPKNGKGVE